MGATASVLPDGAKRFHPDQLTTKTLRKEFPEFAGNLRHLKIESLSSKISFKQDSGKIITEDLENGGSETGSQLRRAKFKWDEGGDVLQRPRSAVVKLTDVTEVPQMKLLMTRSWIKRQIVRYLLGGEGGKYLWNLIPRFILAECAVRRAMSEVPRLDKLLTPLYFSRVRVSSFPSQAQWAMYGIKAVPSSWTVQGMAEIKPPMTSADGPTGHYLTSNVTENIATAVLEGLARFHGACWGMGRESPLVSWILDINSTASTLTLYYPTKFGLAPYGYELPDTNAPMSRGGDMRFTKMNLKKFISGLGLGLKEICAEYIDVLRKLQRIYARVRNEICNVSDGKPGERQPSRYGYSQTMLHGDAHAWNMFWNLNAKHSRDRVKFIDLTNVGQGRCVWEVYYFIVQSWHCTDWMQLHRVLSRYYNALRKNCSPCGNARHGAKSKQKPTEGALGASHFANSNDRANLDSTMPFAAFLREFYLLAIVHCVHVMAEMKRSGKWSGSSAEHLTRIQREEGPKGARVRKDVVYQKLLVTRVLRLARDILRYAGGCIVQSL